MHAQGYRFRLHGRGLPGRPDLVFRKRRMVVFVHGCFWHRHDGCAKSRLPKTRHDYWRSKFEGNVERDKRNEQRLAEDGWRVFVVWECEIEKDEALIERLMEFLGPAPPHRDAANRRGGIGLPDLRAPLVAVPQRRDKAAEAGASLRDCRQRPSFRFARSNDDDARSTRQLPKPRVW